jgi:hypothetical protein
MHDHAGAAFVAKQLFKLEPFNAGDFTHRDPCATTANLHHAFFNRDSAAPPTGLESGLNDGFIVRQRKIFDRTIRQTERKMTVLNVNYRSDNAGSSYC